MNKLIQSDKGVFSVTVAADFLQVHPRTLRIYDAEGLLTPSRLQKNHRRYSQNDLTRGQLIQFLTKECACNLSGIKVIFQLLKDAHIKEENWNGYLAQVANKIGFSEELMIANREKQSHKGRKAKVLV